MRTSQPIIFTQDDCVAVRRWDFCVVWVVLSLAMCLNASAATVIWDGGATSGHNNWSGTGINNSNWDVNGGVKAGDDIIFAGDVRLTPINDTIAGTAYNSITFYSTAGAFVLGGNAITLSGAITNNDADLQTINMALGLNATQTLNAASGAIAIGGVISGVGGITKNGAYIITLSAANTYTGETTVSAGILKAGVVSVANVSGAFGNNSAVTLVNTSGAALEITGFNTQIGSLTGGGATGGNVILGAATLSVGGNNSSPAAYAGIISGTGGSVTKIGTGTQIFSGANTYSGTTTVSAGTLLLNNTTGSATGSGAVTVQTGGTIGGSGTVSGATTIAGNLNPGNNIAVLSFGSFLSLQSTATTLMEITGATRGTQYDGVNVDGALTYGGALITTFGTTFGSSRTFNLFDFASQSGSFASVSLTGSYTGSLVNNGSGVWGLTSGSNVWVFTQSTGDLSLTVIPEPSVALLGGLSVLLLLRRRRD